MRDEREQPTDQKPELEKRSMTNQKRNSPVVFSRRTLKSVSWLSNEFC